jgi:hypothetical protein
LNKFTTSQGKKMTSQTNPLSVIEVTELWSSADAASATPDFAIDVAHAELQTAYRQRMAVVMAGLVAAYSPADHREWLEAAERCLAQSRLAFAWIEQKTATALPQSAQSSAS